jgi:hypothetical protein
MSATRSGNDLTICGRCYVSAEGAGMVSYALRFRAVYASMQ